MRKLIFTNSKDETIELGYHTPYLINKIDGLGETGADIATTEAPYVDGSIYIDTRLSPRELSIEGTFRRLTSPELYKNRQRLQRVLNPKLGVGTLQYEHEGIVKQINAIVDGSPAYADKDREPFQKFQINLLCPDPYWRDPNQVSRALTAYKGYFTLPFKLPFKLGKQGDRTTLINDGDVPAPVSIDLQGPATNPQIRNATTGEFIKINTSIAADEILHIDTTPRHKRIEIYRGDIALNGFGYFDYAGGATFWQLEPGENDVEYYADSGNRDGVVAVAWSNRYVGI